MFFISIGSISIGIMYGIVNMILIPFLSQIFSSTEIPGILISSGMIIASFFSPFIGNWSDRIKKRMPFISFIVLFSVTGALLLLLENIYLNALGAIIIVISAYSMLTPYSSLVADYTTENKRGIAFGLVMGTVNTASFIASLIINYFYNLGSKITLLILMGISLTSFVSLVVFTLRNKPKNREEISQTKNKTTGIISLLKNYPLLLLFFGIQFFSWFSLGGLFPYITSFLTDETNMTIGNASVWFGASTLFSALVAYATGFITRFFKRNTLFFISLVSLTVVLGIYSQFYSGLIKNDPSIVIGIISFFVISVSLGFFYSLSSTILSLFVSNDVQGKVFGLNNIFMILSQAISVGLVGGIIKHFGYQAMVTLGFIGFLIATVFTFSLFTLVGKKEKKMTSEKTN